MRLVYVLPLLLATACSQPKEKAPPVAKATASDLAMAKALASATSDPTLATRVDEMVRRSFIGRPEDDAPPNVYGALSARVECGDEMVTVLYVAADDTFVAGAGAKDTFKEQLRAVAFDKKTVWKNPDKLDRTLGAVDTGKGNALAVADDRPIGERVKSSFAYIGELSKLPGFAAGTDGEVTMDITTYAMTDAGERKFDLETRMHKNWKLTAHPLTPAQRTEVAAYDKRVTQVRAMRHYLGDQAENAQALRKFASEPEIGAALKRFDELVATNKKEIAAIGEIPYADTMKAFSLTNDSCKTASR